jgi:esterase/lipase superfamily enzyme
MGRVLAAVFRRPGRRLEPFGRIVVLGLVLVAPGLGAGPADPATPEQARADAQATSLRVGVPYVTNRSVEGVSGDTLVYGGGRGTPRVGRCEVQFTPIPLVGELASSVPFYVPSETKTVRATEISDAAAFWNDLSAAAAGTMTGSVVLFVHGYSNGFERACRMAAEVQRAVDGQATVLLFTWPSNGWALEYARDQAALEWSVPFLAETLADLGARIGTAKIHVLAHSLGSRGIIFALEWLDPGTKAEPAIAGLILLAPDFDAQTFLAHLPRLAALSRAITLYASDNDAPLKVSHQLHGAPRLGQGGDLRTVVEGVETIDVSPAGRYHITGHEYFYRHPRVAADLARLLVTGERAAQRPELRPGLQGGLPYWEVAGKAAAQAEP